MSLIIYPTTNYDSFISLTDADTVISENTLFSSNWDLLSDANKEIYLRIATTRLLNVIDTSLLDGTDACLCKSCALMAVRDLVFEISTSVNPNTGLVSSEKVGDLQVTYYHGNSNRQVSGKNMNPFPQEIALCLSNYGVELPVGSIYKAKLVHS